MTVTDSSQPLAPSLDLVAKGNLCTGCGLCASLSGGAVQMSQSPDGYLRPQQRAPVSPEVDHIISKTCPGLGSEQTSMEGNSNILWGPIVSAASGFAKDERLMHRSSSGGALSALLTCLLKMEIVDRVLHIAASPDNPLENVAVISHNSEDIYRGAGSRYAPSAPLSILLEEIEKPGKLALVGKPCDISAARALGRIDPRINEKIPYMLSFFCAGVPSLKGARQILEKLGVSEADVRHFRYRGEGWPGKATAVLRDGREFGMSYTASWGDILSKHVQFRCKICPDGSGGSADIVCADAWHCDDDGYPLFEEQQGRSLILARSKLGQSLLDMASYEGFLEKDPFDIYQIQQMQPSQVIRKQSIIARLSAVKTLALPIPEYRGYNLWTAALHAGVVFNVKNYFGMIKRLVRSRRNEGLRQNS